MSLLMTFDPQPDLRKYHSSIVANALQATSVAAYCLLCHVFKVKGIRLDSFQAMKLCDAN